MLTCQAVSQAKYGGRLPSTFAIQNTIKRFTSLPFSILYQQQKYVMGPKGHLVDLYTVRIISVVARQRYDHPDHYFFLQSSFQADHRDVAVPGYPTSFHANTLCGYLPI
jgi:hypothetical protein